MKAKNLDICNIIENIPKDLKISTMSFYVMGKITVKTIILHYTPKLRLRLYTVIRRRLWLSQPHLNPGERDVVIFHFSLWFSCFSIFTATNWILFGLISGFDYTMDAQNQLCAEGERVNRTV